MNNNNNITFALFADEHSKDKVRIVTTAENAAIIKKFIDIVNDSQALQDILPYLVWEEDNNDEFYTL